MINLSLSYYILGIIGLISGLVVVSAMNPIHRIVYLVIVFLVGAFILTFLDYYFLGLTYIIVYVGAIAILFLFVIMMVQIPIVSTKTMTSYIPNILIRENANLLKTETSKINSEIILLHLLKNSFNSHKNIDNKTKNEIIFNSSFLYNFLNYHELKNIDDLKLENLQNYNSLNSNLWRKRIFSKSSLYISFLVSFIILILSYIMIDSSLDLVSYFYPSWFIEYKTMTDIETLAIIVYVAYPTALVLISIALWVVLIGILSICSPQTK